MIIRTQAQARDERREQSERAQQAFCFCIVFEHTQLSLGVEKTTSTFIKHHRVYIYVFVSYCNITLGYLGRRERRRSREARSTGLVTYVHTLYWLGDVAAAQLADRRHWRARALTLSRHHATHHSRARSGPGRRRGRGKRVVDTLERAGMLFSPLARRVPQRA